MQSPPSPSCSSHAYLKPLFWALVVPAAVVLFQPVVLRWYSDWRLMVIILGPFIIVARIVHAWVNGEGWIRTAFRHIRPMPHGFSVLGTDAGVKSFPWVTVYLILINTVLFFALPERIVDRWVFPPHGDHSNLHLCASMVTSAFLHGNLKHLAGNMVFLWAFGSVLESRMGTLPFLGAYTFCLVTSKLAVMILLVLQVGHLASDEVIADFHSLGASGAIFGVMGLFAVRCFFARVTMGVPFLFIPFLTIPLRVQGLFLIALYFAMNIQGGVRQFGAMHSGTNHWAHLGGYLGGLALGLFMRLHVPAAEEARRVRAERIAGREVDTAESTAIYRSILEKHPDDATALAHMLEHHRFNPVEAETYFVRLVTSLCARDFARAVELVTERYPAHLKALPGGVLLRLGAHYRRTSEFDKARFCLEFALEKKGPWQAKALLDLGEVFVDLGNDERARTAFESVAETYPGSDFARQARSAMQLLAGGAGGVTS
jgi:membrane associated rhomboid family serine protease